MRNHILFAALMAGVATLAQTVPEARLPAPGQVMVRTYATGAVDPAPVGVSPVGFSLVPGLAWPDATMDVDWFRFNLLLGSHRRVRGVDLGLIANMCDTESTGIALAALYNSAAYSSGGWHLAGAFNYCDRTFKGLQVAAVLSYCDGDVWGVQVAVCNICEHLTGVQLGVANMAAQGSGVQVGLINNSERLAGAQIGLLNLNLDSSVPVLPIFNAAF